MGNCEDSKSLRPKEGTDPTISAPPRSNIVQPTTPQKLMHEEKENKVPLYLALLDERGYKESKQVCGSGYRIERFCYNEKCNGHPSMCSTTNDCSTCQKLHLNCPNVTLKQLKEHIEQRFQLRKKFFLKMFAIENELINRFTEVRRELIQKSKVCNFEGLSLAAFEFIYLSNSKRECKGKQVKALFNQLLEKKNQQKTGEYFETYQKQGQQIVSSWLKAQQTLIQKSSAKGAKLQSKILAEDKQGVQKFSFLLKQLNSPSQLKLLFRASQHNFSASKFHQCCDNISDTVTIVRTEFGRTIAAYTPLKWGTTVNQWVADDSGRSFLLQLELKEKMILTQPQYAILNNPNYGPIFGHDLQIADQCNQNQKSYSNFPNSYNCNGKYQQNQQSRTAFCGSPKGCDFRVVEYEVFVVESK